MSKEDWMDMWAEFNLSQPDADGHQGASRTQLKLALQVADERLSINEGVSEGHIREVTTTDRHGLTKPVRYRLNIAGGAQ